MNDTDEELDAVPPSGTPLTNAERMQPYDRLAWGALFSVVGISLTFRGAMPMSIDSKGVGYIFVGLALLALMKRLGADPGAGVWTKRLFKVAAVLCVARGIVLVAPIPQPPLLAPINAAEPLLACALFVLMLRTYGSTQRTRIAGAVALVLLNSHWTVTCVGAGLLVWGLRGKLLTSFCALYAGSSVALAFLGDPSKVRFDLLSPIKSLGPLFTAQGEALMYGVPIGGAILALIGLVWLPFQIRRALRDGVKPGPSPRVSLEQVSKACLGLLVLWAVGGLWVWGSRLEPMLERWPVSTTPASGEGEVHAVLLADGALVVASRVGKRVTVHTAAGPVQLDGESEVPIPFSLRRSGDRVAVGERGRYGTAVSVQVLRGGKVEWRCPRPENTMIHNPALSPGGRVAYTVTNHEAKTSEVEVYDLQQGTTRTLKGLRVRVLDLCFAPGTELLVGTDVTGGLIVWDAVTGKVLYEHALALRGHSLFPGQSPGQVLAVAHDQPLQSFGRWTSSSAAATQLVELDATTGQLLRTLDVQRAGRPVWAAVHGDQALLASDYGVRFLDMHGKRRAVELSGYGFATSVGFDAEGLPWIVDRKGRTYHYAWRPRWKRVLLAIVAR